jgi:hypothetical protein
MANSLLQSSLVPLGLSRAPVGGAPPKWRTLPFTIQRQTQEQWCWAAVSASVSRFYNSRTSWTQCALANNQFGQVSCCSKGFLSQCNKPWYLDRALDKVGHFRAFSSGAAMMGQVQSEVDAGRPLPVRVGWPVGGGHFLLITGYSSMNALDVQDPWSGSSTVNYEVFRLRYRGNGRWTHSYWTKR